MWLVDDLMPFLNIVFILGDVAAGAFIVQQAGGEICDFKGANHWLHRKEILATNGLLNEEMLELVGRIKST